ncbi:MAG: THUMP domain-containing class I SAM-dependent RNA methyltransferase [Bdellovibrionales bacterium]
MPKFFATCSKGLAPALESELKSFDLKLKAFFMKDSGVGFECSWDKAYEINLRSKVASRVLMPVLDYKASSDEQITHGLKKFDFAKYIPKNGTFSLRVKLQRNSRYRDQRFVMNQIRVGLLEHFEDIGRKDISVSVDEPDVEIFVGVFGVQFSYSLNLSGPPLSNRGYRLEGERAPLRENLGAGLIKLTGWDGTVPLVDFFCGSGTFLFEAATIKDPNPLNRFFGFTQWENFDSKKYEDLLDKVKALENQNSTQIYGFDQDPRSIESVRTNIEDLNLSKHIHFKQVALKDLNPTAMGLEKGIVILNPPYGERLGNFDDALKVYTLIGEVLKEQFSGWKAFILSPDTELTKALKMKAFYKTTVDNGGIDCAYLGYEIN